MEPIWLRLGRKWKIFVCVVGGRHGRVEALRAQKGNCPEKVKKVRMKAEGFNRLT